MVLLRLSDCVRTLTVKSVDRGTEREVPTFIQEPIRTPGVCSDVPVVEHKGEWR